MATTKSDLSIKDYYTYGFMTFGQRAGNAVLALAEKTKALQQGPLAFITMPLQPILYNFLKPLGGFMRDCAMNNGRDDTPRFLFLALPALAGAGFAAYLAAATFPAALTSFSGFALLAAQAVTFGMIGVAALPLAYAGIGIALGVAAGTVWAGTTGLLKSFINVPRGMSNTVAYFNNIFETRSANKAALAQAQAQRQHLLSHDKILPPAEVTGALQKLSEMDMQRLSASFRAQFPSGTPQDKAIDALTSDFATTGEALRTQAADLLGKYKAAV